MTEDALDLSGQLLIAMPEMGDTRFDQSVIYICAHSDEGAMGLIVNKPATDVRFPKLLEQLDIPVGPGVRNIRVHVGGPVEHARGFVLHTNAKDDIVFGRANEYKWTAALKVLGIDPMHLSATAGRA